MSTNSKQTRKPLTPTEKTLLEWLKSGQVGNSPESATGNTWIALERKGYTKNVRIPGTWESRMEFPEA